MPTNPYLGFSALTGQVSEYHECVAAATSLSAAAPCVAELIRALLRRRSIISVSSSSAILSTNNPAKQGVKTKKKKGSSYKPRGGGGVGWFVFFLKGIGASRPVPLCWRSALPSQRLTRPSCSSRPTALLVVAGFGYSAYAKYAAKKEKQNRSKRAW